MGYARARLVRAEAGVLLPRVVVPQTRFFWYTLCRKEDWENEKVLYLYCGDGVLHGQSDGRDAGQVHPLRRGHGPAGGGHGHRRPVRHAGRDAGGVDGRGRRHRVPRRARRRRDVRQQHAHHVLPQRRLGTRRHGLRDVPIRQVWHCHLQMGDRPRLQHDDRFHGDERHGGVVPVVGGRLSGVERGEAGPDRHGLQPLHLRLQPPWRYDVQVQVALLLAEDLAGRRERRPPPGARFPSLPEGRTRGPVRRRLRDDLLFLHGNRPCIRHERRGAGRVRGVRGGAWRHLLRHRRDRALRNKLRGGRPMAEARQRLCASERARHVWRQ